MGVEDFAPSGTDIKETGFGYTMSILGGKYKMIIMYWLASYRVLRFNELKRCIGKVSFKMLSQTLKEMEADKLIIRNAYPQVPPKVEYSLTNKGASLIPILDAMCKWGLENGLLDKPEMPQPEPLKTP